MTEPVTDLDYALLRRVARGEASALAELIRRHQTRVYQIAYRLLKDPLAAEDAAQEVFIKVFKNARRFEPKASVSAWLNRITANLCLNLLRQKRPTSDCSRDVTAPTSAAAQPTARSG